jgi:hypothetical protein
MSMCGARPRYGSTSCDGKGRTARSASASDNPSSAVRKNRTSPAARSTSASVGSTNKTRSRAAAAAANSAFAAGVSPVTLGTRTPIPARLTAVFSRARSVSEEGAKVAM